MSGSLPRNCSGFRTKGDERLLGKVRKQAGAIGRRMPLTETPLAAETEERIQQIGETDILVGIPSYNNAETIGHVVRAVKAGLAKYFPAGRSVLVNSDGGSTDGTADVVARAAVDFQTLFVADHQSPFHKIITPYHGIPGKGSAFRTIFEIARRLGARACAVVDSDLRSITPEWIELLLRPVLEGGYDYVAPYYLRHKYDGTITNSIVYPLTRALYGKRIRQPIGGDFGFSGRLAEHYLDQHVWESDVARFGVDSWMTTRRWLPAQASARVFSAPKSTTPRIRRPICRPCWCRSWELSSRRWNSISRPG